MYSKNNIYPFHMPGHKRNKSFLPKDLLELDTTEIHGLDNLHNPKTVIKAAQDYASKVWDTDNSYFLVNGSSSGIMAAVMSICKDGDTLLASRNSHLSLYNSLIISGAKPIYVNPEVISEGRLCGLAGGITPEKLEMELRENSQIRAVFVTSPTYEGFVSDIKRIAEITHLYGRYLIVDEAHGAHFVFSEYFPKSAIMLGADIVIQSLHKTLPTLGQSAILHVNNKKIDTSRLAQCLSMVQTTSPSYMFMCVMQNTISQLTENKSLFEEYVNLLQEFRDDMKELNHIKLIGQEICGRHSVFDVDLGKLVFSTETVQAETCIGNILRDKYKIQIETESQRHIIAMTSVADTKEGFERFRRAIKEIDKDTANTKSIRRLEFMPCLPKIAFTPREAWSREKVKIALKDAAGTISAENVAVYPPGIPIVAVGEIITSEIIEYINISGIQKHDIYIVKEVNKP